MAGFTYVEDVTFTIIQNHGAGFSFSGLYSATGDYLGNGNEPFVQDGITGLSTPKAALAVTSSSPRSLHLLSHCLSRKSPI